jgi:hypothetical protein
MAEVALYSCVFDNTINVVAVFMVGVVPARPQLEVPGMLHVAAACISTCKHDD